MLEPHMSDGTNSAKTWPQGFVLVMEPDADVRAMMGTALRADGRRVELLPDCASVLAWRSAAPIADELILTLGAGERDPDWEALRLALDEDPRLAKAPVIVVLTILNGFTFPKRARIVQKPFAIETLLSMVASDVADSLRRLG
jgi:hypothetical protein